VISTGPSWALLGLLSSPLIGQESSSTPSLGVRVQVDPAQIEFGANYSLLIEREWPLGWLPKSWNGEALADLRLELLEHEEAREQDGRLLERWTFRGQGYALDELVVPALRFTASPSGGGPELAAESAETRVLVTASVNHEDPGPPELPREPFGPPSQRRPWIPAAVILTVGCALWVLWRGRARKPDSEAPPGVEPTLEERHAAIAASFERDPNSLRLVEELADLVRGAVENSPGRRRTTEQLLAAPETASALPVALRDLLAGFLRRCDLV